MSIPHKRVVITGRRERRKKQGSAYADKLARWRAMERVRKPKAGARGVV